MKKVELCGSKTANGLWTKSDRNLADALRYAGFTGQAYKSAINVKRNTDKGKNYVTISAD
jgi:hypothetical protein